MRYIYSILFLLSHFVLFAQNSQANLECTKSEYKDGRYFHTYSTCMVNAPAEEVDAVLDEIYNGLKNEPTKNLRWAFYGLGKSKSKEDNVQLYEKNVFYNPASGIYVVNLMMIMDDSDEFEFSLEGELKNEKVSSGKHNLILGITKKVKVLNDGNIHIASEPKGEDKTELSIHSMLKFGFIIDLFFTQSKYKEVIEWRLAKFILNLKYRAEDNYMQKLRAEISQDKQ